MTDDDARAHFESASEHDSAGRERDAAREYEAALAAGLNGELLAQLHIQYASTLRNLGRPDDAIAVLEEAAPSDARSVFTALALHDAGRPSEALRVAIEALVPHLPRYGRSATEYARLLTEPESPQT